MDNRAVALKLILDHLGTSDISTVEHRMEVQKAVYLTQAVGIPLGYSYGWYLKGPYSPALTRDYYSIPEDEPISASLKAGAIEKLDRVRILMDENIAHLRRPQKLELLASLHYLRKNSGFSKRDACKKIAETKPYLAQHCDRGFDILEANDLI